MFSLLKDLKLMLTIRDQNNSLKDYIADLKSSKKDCELVIEELKAKHVKDRQHYYDKGRAESVAQCGEPAYQRALAKARQKGFDDGWVYGKIATRAENHDYALPNDCY